jgi:hypothetical protein
MVAANDAEHGHSAMSPTLAAKFFVGADDIVHGHLASVALILSTGTTPASRTMRAANDSRTGSADDGRAAASGGRSNAMSASSARMLRANKSARAI